MLVICYGMAKSGSTLSFELVRGVLKSAGFAQGKIRAAGLKPRARGNYLVEVTRETISEIISVVGSDRIIAVKTHQDLPQELFGWFEELNAHRKLQVVTSYRDPRDVSLSLLDAGARARSKGLQGFSNIHDLDDAADLVEKAIRKFRKWSSLQGALRLYYGTFVNTPDDAINAIETALGVLSDHSAVIKHAFEDAFTQKNKAKKNRFEDEMTEAVKAEMHARFEVFIEKVCKDNAEDWFASCRAEMSSDL